MALDQSALLGLLGELKLTDVSDRIRVATETLYQELIDAEAAAFIGAAPFCRRRSSSEHLRRSKSERLGGSLALVLFRSDAGQGVDASVTESVAGALEGEDVGVVDDAVDHRGGDDLVAEHAAPAGERQVRGQDQ